MSLVTWFRRATAPEYSPRLKALVNRVVEYLKSRPPDEEIVPKIVARAIGETELACVTALSILERRGITQQHFGVYCKESRVSLATVDDLHNIGPCYYCELHDEDHCAADRTSVVEVYFTINEDQLAKVGTAAVAA
jgi:hypothetical protein